MKLSRLLHSVQLREDSWIFQGERPAHIRRACDRLSRFGITAFCLYVAVLVIDALLHAMHNIY